MLFHFISATPLSLIIAATQLMSYLNIYSLRCKIINISSVNFNTLGNGEQIHSCFSYTLHINMPDTHRLVNSQ